MGAAPAYEDLEFRRVLIFLLGYGPWLSLFEDVGRVLPRGQSQPDEGVKCRSQLMRYRTRAVPPNMV